MRILTSRNTLILLLILVTGFWLMAFAQKKGGGGSTGPLYLLATFLDPGNEITSDNGSAYRHGVDGQVTLGKPGAGRFRLDLGKFNQNQRELNINLSACGAACDNINGPQVAFLQSGSEFIPQRDGLGNIIGWTTSGETALDLRSMKIADGDRYANLYAQLTADAGGFSRRFIYSRPEHVLEVWRCNDELAEPAKVACTAENSGGSCVTWEISGKNGCFRKAQDSLNRTWSSIYLEDVGFQVSLVPAP
ncbi:MAG: hypothetical protein ACRD2Q_02970 [Terriglobales bacterium]